MSSALASGAPRARATARWPATSPVCRRSSRRCRTDIGDLDPPDKLKGDSDKLTSALGAIEQDVSSISAAGKSGDAQAARQSAQKLVADSQQVNSAQNKLAKATGAPAGDR